MIWDIITKKIVDAGLAIEGQTLFQQRMPADVKVCIGLFEPLEGIKVDPHLPNYHKPKLKIILRHNRVQDGTKLARQLSDLLTITTEEEYEATEDRGRVILKIFRPVSLPIQYPALVGDTTEWSINFETAFTLGRETLPSSP